MMMFLLSKNNIVYAANKTINYQATIFENSGDIIMDDDYAVVFKIYNQDSGGEAVWEEERMVTVINGVFSVMLGEVNSFDDIDFSEDIYLGVDFNNDGEMEPRKKIGASIYSLDSDKLDGLDSSSFLRSDTSASLVATSSDTLLNLEQKGTGNLLDIKNNSNTIFFLDAYGNLAIGTTSPTSLAKLDVYGNAILSGSDRYLNFGDTVGETGYGIRDNNGSIEAKNSDGDWQSIFTGSSNLSIEDVSIDDLEGSSTLAYLDRENHFTVTSSFSGLAIGTTSPTLSAKLDVYGNTILSGSDRYLNFGTTTGETGYGIRDNDGTIEVKNSDGEWDRVISGDEIIIGSSENKGLFDIQGNIITSKTGDILDISCVYPSTDFLIGEDLGQSFIVHNTGILSKISVHTYVAGVNAELRIYQGEGLDGELLATQTVYLMANQWNDINISDEVYLTEGEKYSFFFIADYAVQFPVSDGDQYLDGTSQRLSGEKLLEDLRFKIYSRQGGFIQSDYFVGDGFFINDSYFNFSTTTGERGYGIRNNNGNIEVKDDNGSWSDIVLLGSNGALTIGTTSPTSLAKLDVYGNTILSGSDRYLNFGTTTGETGYGIRDNNGIMEVKNSNGEWGDVLTVSNEMNIGSTTNNIVLDMHGNLVLHETEEVLDIFCNEKYNNSASSDIGQSFTAENGGVLTKIRVEIANPDISSVELRIYQGEGYNGELLNSQPVTLVNNQWNEFIISDEIYLIPGGKYTFGFFGNGSDMLRFWQTDGDKYSGGAIYYDDSMSNVDLVFEVYSIKGGFVQADYFIGDGFFINNDYFNFSTTIGEAGYGIRDKNGKIEIKDNDGEWKSVAKIASGTTGSLQMNDGSGDLGNTDNLVWDLVDQTLDIKGNVFAKDLNFSSSTIAANNTWVDVAYGNGLFVAVAQDGANRIMTSADGSNWILQSGDFDSYEWSEIEYGNGLFVALEKNKSKVAISSDGFSWVLNDNGPGSIWYEGFRYLNGLFIHVGGNCSIKYSPDGENWISKSFSGPSLDNCRDISYGNGFYVVIGDQYAAKSSDFENWIITDDITSTYLANIVYGNDTFVAVAHAGSSKRVVVSSDGENWTDHYSNSEEWWRIIYEDGLFVTLNRDCGVMISVDGIDWENISTPFNCDNNLYLGLTYGQETFVAVGGNYNKFLISSQTALARLDAYGNVILSGSNRHLNFGDTVGISGYGIRDNEGVMQSKDQDGEWKDIVQTASGDSGSLQINDGFGNFSYTDDLTWDSTEEILNINGRLDLAGEVLIADLVFTENNISSNNQWSGVAYGDGLFVAVSTNGTNRVMISSDGINWTEQLVPDRTWSDIAYGNGLFVAITSDSDAGDKRVMTSPDGINWTERSVPIKDWMRITYGDGLFVAGAFAFGTGISDAIMTSPDGINWTQRTHDPTVNFVTLFSVAYGNGMFIASTYSDKILFSTDGIVWNTRQLPITNKDSNWKDITYGNGVFTMISGSDTNNKTVMTSSDGENWNLHQLETSYNFTQIKYDGGLFLVIDGSDNILSSLDGVNWSEVSSPEGCGWRDTAYGDNLFVAVNDDCGSVGIAPVAELARLDVYGNTIISGSNRYLNFGDTVGLSGYGFRDNNGVMQFKNSDGDWSNFSNATGTEGLLQISDGSGNFVATDNLNWDLASNTLAIDGNVSIGTSSTNAQLELYKADASSFDIMFQVASSSGVGMRIMGDGEIFSDKAFNSTGADYAEYFYTKDIDLRSGEVVCIDTKEENSIKRCARGADSNIMGIVSSNPSIIGNFKKEYENNLNYKIIGMLGQVPARVSNENGEIRPGDSLASASNTPGYLMRAQAGDSTVGVALEKLKGEKGIINVLISRKNKSITVEEVEEQVSARIADMEIEDEVNILVSEAIDNLSLEDLDQDIDEIIDPKLLLLEEKIKLGDTQLSDKIDKIDNETNSIKSKLNNLIASSSVIDEINYRVVDIEEIIKNKIASNTLEVEIVEINNLASSSDTALVVNQEGSGDIANFRNQEVDVVKIARDGKVSIVGELLIDGRIMVCSGGVCGDYLEETVDETMGDVGIEGRVVAGSFESYCDDGFVWVAGNSKYGTMPGFCVMNDKARTSDYDINTDLYNIINKDDLIWTNLTQGEAQFACKSLGDGYHLLSENEWLTIAENIIDNFDNDIDSNTSGLQLATSSDELTGVEFRLMSNNRLYGLAGNSGEWVDKVISREDVPEPVSEDWQEFFNIKSFKYLSDLIPPYYLDSSNGIGKILTSELNLNDNNLRAFVRGKGGLYSLDLSNSPVSISEDISFRCAK